ncbi:MAG TPA: hypothetical protein DCZ95_03560 [Verrucomicrobia bacterium]|nr:hypothetical protein [Verrucomicrobiota bacterium]
MGLRLGWASLLVACLSARATTTVQPLYSGTMPLSELATAPDGKFYGTTRHGGSNDLGTVFSLTTSGVFTTIYAFSGGADGAHPCAALALGANGHLYGTAPYGGAQNAGSVFEVTTAGSFTLLHLFAGGSDGAEPTATLAVGSDGLLYGVASRGGAFGCGTIFRINAGGIFTNLHDFTGIDGDHPAAALTPLGGALYGTTQYGGAGNCGTVFKISTNGVYSLLFSFNGLNGAIPRAALARSSNGVFYGTTAYGGEGGFGSIFRITSAGSFESLYSFIGENLGSNPSGGLLLEGNRYVQGSTALGGAHGFGSIFWMTVSGGIDSFYSFNGDETGANPATALAQGSDGNLYGTSGSGGTGGGGTFFKLTMPPYFDAIQILSGQQVRYSGAGGTPNGQYILLTTTNLMAPITNWVAAGALPFDSTGRFSFTNTTPKTINLMRLP